MRLVIREGSVLAGIGGAAGLVGAPRRGPGLARLLYGVTPLDAVTLTSVISIVVVVALIAVGRPAWCASRVDPCTALRGE